MLNDGYREFYQGDADSDNIHVDAEQYYKETFKSE
jgi:hypothetical protein